MKSETKKEPAQAFVDENRFVNRVIIHNKNRTLFFPEPNTPKKKYFERLIAEQKNSAPDAHTFMLTPNAYVYSCHREKAVFICECSVDVSVSQVKMEFDAFIDVFHKQGKFPRFISSFFDR